MENPIIRNSRVLVTGSAGFIGSNLVDALIGDNEVVVVDDLSMGRVENLPQSNNLHFFKHSIADFKFMSELLKDWKFDYIFLLAAVASVADTIVRPAETHIINQDANLNVLETVRINKLDVKKILFSSSAAVYGNNPELPKKETSPIDPLSPYAVDKFATERFVIDYGRLYDIPTVATRFFNVYGPKQNPKSPYSGVLSIVSDALYNAKKFTLYGSGMQTRDFVYIDDVVNALILLMLSDKALNTVFNVATGEQHPLMEVIKDLERVASKKVEILMADSRIGDIQNSVADISKIRDLGYKPQFSLQNGLEKYYQSLGES